MFQNRQRLFIGCVFLGAVIVGVAEAQPGRGRNDPEFRTDQATFHFLLTHRQAIKRSVKALPDGVETVTESDKPEVARQIQAHVAAMHQRVKEGRPIHMRDPLFRALFARAKQISMKVENTPKGVKVRETAKDPYTVKVIQAHARVVSLFVQKGFAEVRTNHTPPQR